MEPPLGPGPERRGQPDGVVPIATTPCERGVIQAFLDGLHRHTALLQLLRGVDSMEAPAFMQG
ncbi:MAG: hypothetical protein ACXACF_06875 [Candidatus Hermodarchaeia archaeon]